MTPLRPRMMQDLQLRGYSDRTVEAYVRAVAQLAQVLSCVSRPAHGRAGPPVPGPPEHRPEGYARDAHHRALRHQVLLSAHARAAVDRPRRRAPQRREETPRRLEPRRGVADPRRGSHRRLPRLPHHHLRLRPPPLHPRAHTRDEAPDAPGGHVHRAIPPPRSAAGLSQDPLPWAAESHRRARYLLDLHAVASTAPASDTATVDASVAGAIILAEPVALPTTRSCPVCRRGALRLVARMRRCRAPPDMRRSRAALARTHRGEDALGALVQPGCIRRLPRRYFQRATRRVPPARRAPESPSRAVVAPPSTALFLAGSHR